jgi:putative Mg2+ transporter-C (MgtC) family protein
MPLNIGWEDIALRLALTVIAGLLIGHNRTEHGKAAGLRTTVLVCLAASVAMIQVNLLLPTAGRASDSFIMNDLMRLPLGILTGVGFIGGGQIGLGIAATAIGLAALWGVPLVEARLRRERRARLSVELQGGALSEAAIRRMLEAAGLRISGLEVSLSDAGARRTLIFDLLEFSLPFENKVPPIFGELANEAGVRKIDWKRP